MKINNEMHIVYASDNNFAELLGISMLSLFENNKNCEKIQIYIINNEISKENIKRLEMICIKYNRNLPILIETKNINTILGISVLTDRGSLSQYARLFVSSLLPANIERVLYLDCDTIINHTLEELWNLDLNGRIIAALNDAFSKYYRKNIELQPNDIMFNSGVMLIDLNKWKDEQIENKLMNFIKVHRGKIQQGDQGALNAVLYNSVKCFHPKFNSVTIFYDFTYEDMLVYRKPPTFYSKQEIKESVKNPVIIHYTTSFLSKRPWIQGSQHKYRDKWLYYKELSPWKNEPLRFSNEKGSKKAYLTIYKLIPSNISIRIAGIIQAYGRPFWYRFKNIILQ